jgi:molybdenum cofactor cytidylyltransferase
MQEPSFQPVGILLCAGRGTRFDPEGRRDKLMQTLPGGELVALASARKLLAATGRVLAVVRPDSEALPQLLAQAGCEVVVCEDAGLGMSASLRAGLARADQAPAWLLALADMPHVAPATYQALLAALAAGRAMVAPVHESRRGNPVGFNRSQLGELLTLTGDAGARSLLTGSQLTLVPVDDPGIHRDIDTPADLA